MESNNELALPIMDQPAVLDANEPAASLDHQPEASGMETEPQAEDLVDPLNAQAEIHRPLTSAIGNTARVFPPRKAKTPLSRGAASAWDYEEKYPADEYGREMASDARVWRVYLDEADMYDAEMISSYMDTIDILLVFAGLFSAVVTTFVVQASQALRPDYPQIAASLISELISLQRAAMDGIASRDIPPSSPALSSTTSNSLDVWVNGLWFTSLTFGLGASLVSVLVKQWLRHYISALTGSPRDRATTRQGRFNGLTRWGVPAIIGLLPALLHVALLLFLAGLILFILPLNHPIGFIVSSITAVIYAAYLSTHILPIIYSYCPYRTPLSDYARQLVLTCSAWSSSIILRFRPGPPSDSTKEVIDPVPGDPTRHERFAQTLRWLQENGTNPSVGSVVRQALACCPLHLHPFSHLLDVKSASNIASGHIRNLKSKELSIFERQQLETALRALALNHRPGHTLDHERRIAFWDYHSSWIPDRSLESQIAYIVVEQPWNVEYIFQPDAVLPLFMWHSLIWSLARRLSTSLKAVSRLLDDADQSQSTIAFAELPESSQMSYSCMLDLLAHMDTPWNDRSLDWYDIRPSRLEGAKHALPPALLDFVLRSVHRGLIHDKDALARTADLTSRKIALDIGRRYLRFLTHSFRPDEALRTRSLRVIAHFLEHMWSFHSQDRWDTEAPAVVLGYLDLLEQMDHAGLEARDMMACLLCLIPGKLSPYAPKIIVFILRVLPRGHAFPDIDNSSIHQYMGMRALAAVLQGSANATAAHETFATHSGLRVLRNRQNSRRTRDSILCPPLKNEFGVVNAHVKYLSQRFEDSTQLYKAFDFDDLVYLVWLAISGHYAAWGISQYSLDFPWSVCTDPVWHAVVKTVVREANEYSATRGHLLNSPQFPEEDQEVDTFGRILYILEQIPVFNILDEDHALYYYCTVQRLGEIQPLTIDDELVFGPYAVPYRTEPVEVHPELKVVIHS